MCNFCRGNGEYLEYHIAVKIPLQVLNNQDAAVRRYKYRVESSATKKGLLNSWEFISGPTSVRGCIVDRCLKLYAENTTCGCKFNT